MTNNDELVRRAQDGDADAMEQALAANEGLVASIARKHAGINGAELGDLMQEGRIGLWHAIQRFDPMRGSFATCATGWIRREVLRALQPASGAPLPLIELDAPLTEEGDTLVDLLADPEADPEGRIVEAEWSRFLLALLPPRDRTVVAWRLGFCDGGPRSLAEIAGALGITVSAVDRRVTRATRRLARSIRGEDPHREGHDVVVC
jgi:RNA polymerase sigma factor (sigma-70 family)